MEVLGIELHEKEGKAIYSLKLECHISSYLCTAQNKETFDIDLVILSNKVIYRKENKRCTNPQQWRGQN
jgi:hypothetical protein